MIAVAAEGLIAQGATIEREVFTSELFEEIEPLARMHWREIAHYPDIPLDVDVARFVALEQAGALRFFTARLDGTLVGYACFIVTPHSHYCGSLHAMQDVLFVDPACRCSSIGIRLIRRSEAALAAEDVQVVTQHAKAARAPLHAILPREGYELVDLVYAKRLDRKRGS